MNCISYDGTKIRRKSHNTLVCLLIIGLLVTPNIGACDIYMGKS